MKWCNFNFHFFPFPFDWNSKFFLKWKKIFLLYHFWWRCLPTPGFSSKCSFVHSSMVPLSILNKYKGNQHLINKSLVKYAKTKYQNHNLLTNSLEKGVVKTICIKLWKFWIFHSIFQNSTEGLIWDSKMKEFSREKSYSCLNVQCTVPQIYINIFLEKNV